MKLEQLLSYQNHYVISRYQRDYPSSKLSAEQLFEELMKYIWLACKHKEDRESDPENKQLDFECVMYSEMNEIDNMWHTFLLFTMDYSNFCQDYLNGIFFHHLPAVEKPKQSEEMYALQLERYLSYIYDQLGEETLITWFPCEENLPVAAVS